MTYKPTPLQQAVIDSTAPVTIVLAGAGTGKTTTAAAATGKFLHSCDTERGEQRRAAILSGRRTRLPPQARVLFMSFSRTAVTQVIDRAGGVIGPYLSRIDVSTFHGMAWRMINDFGERHGFPAPQGVLSAAEAKVPGGPVGLTYDELMPAATTLLQIPQIAAHYAARYRLVICDEFQDTDDTEWEFLQLIAPGARRIFLGDLNQAIYEDMKKINPARRVELAKSLPGAITLPLPAASHRDPSGVLPAAADAARQRHFDDPAIHQAVVGGRLTVTRSAAADVFEHVVALIRDARARQHTVNIFTHTMAATSLLSDLLVRQRIVHEQVGFTEANAEAIAAQHALLQFGLNIDGANVRRALAVYVTANTRVKGGGLAPLATQMLDKSNLALESRLLTLARELRQAGTAADGPEYPELADIVAGAYARVGMSRGEETWARAMPQTRAAIGQLAGGSTFDDVSAALKAARNGALVGAGNQRPRAIQVMNLHQTKGREADTTILLLQDDEYHGRERPPFPTGSKLLYVVMTRARHQAHIVVPATPHPLWRPLVEACETSLAVIQAPGSG
ncbi:UvrD-helicase domain-containing protein [Paractinoplanes hotanensis]|uniref:UvrD-helicase domain-containing protein n=1 Tax=Paractinoplanes hotanensis TaxID=2906497 RepID=A0ABT0Y888_9ACTN|nr:UvrD-helicase domain-containing protein [Actinoplanes hotanensis]MCM4082266.1 UvrD-helicase domain-containing protein [Actinoplanes hotanensis]